MVYRARARALLYPTAMTEGVEHEMKFPVAHAGELRRLLAALGGVLRAPLHDEENWVLDDPAGRLRDGGLLLRVRRTSAGAQLTFKGTARFEGGVKSREEIECGVEDAERLLLILARLALTPVRRYQKRREEWSLGGIAVALDETPMGTFVELEGAPEELVATARALGLDPHQAVRGTYLDLWEEYRKDHPQAPRDMVFR